MSVELYKVLEKEVEELYDKRHDDDDMNKLYTRKCKEKNNIYNILTKDEKKQLRDEKYNRWLNTDIEETNKITDFNTLKEQHIKILKDYYGYRNSLAYYQEQHLKDMDTIHKFLKEISKLREAV
jgi:hypothetical protein